LALITNGAAEPQRAKVMRFALEHRFDHTQIEGEHGFGKPEERAYNHAMEVLDVGPDETWRKSWHPNGSVFTRSGTRVTGRVTPQLPDPARPHHPPPVGIAAVAELRALRAGRWHCFGLWRAPPAGAQTGPGIGYNRAAQTQAICRQYAAA
jgi:hypothetical protein